MCPAIRHCGPLNVWRGIKTSINEWHEKKNNLESYIAHKGGEKIKFKILKALYVRIGCNQRIEREKKNTQRCWKRAKGVKDCKHSSTAYRAYILNLPKNKQMYETRENKGYPIENLLVLPTGEKQLVWP